MMYSQGLKARLVRRMAGPERISAVALAREVGIGQPTPSRWLREARAAGRSPGATSQVAMTNKKRSAKKQWTVEDKLRILVESSKLAGNELGEYLRREGVHDATLTQWRADVTKGLAVPSSRSSSASSPDAKRIAALERELHRKDKALAELAALITLQKKSVPSGGTGSPTRTRGARHDPRPHR
jgi:transposase